MEKINTIHLEIAIKVFRDRLKNDLINIITEKGRIDDSGFKYIPSGDMSDESLYLSLECEPTWSDKEELEYDVLAELGSVGLRNNNTDVYVSTDCGVWGLDELGCDDLLRIAKYVNYIFENETK